MRETKFKGLKIMLILVLMQIVVKAQIVGDSWKSVQSRGSGTISLAYVDTPGFVYKRNGQLTGICVDIINDFVDYVNKTKHVNLSINFVGDGSSFTGMYKGVKVSKGGVFGLGNVTITNDRKKEVRFSPPFVTNFALLVTNRNVPTLRNMKDVENTFTDFMAYTTKGTLHERRILDIKQNYLPDLKINYVESSNETVEKVMNNQQSFSYLDLAFYLNAVQNKEPVKRHAPGDKSKEEFGIIMPMECDWQPVLEEFFSANGGYVNSIKYKKILSSHLGSTGVKLLQSVQ